MLHTILLQSAPAFNVNVAAELMKQGPLITSLILAIWYFYNRQKEQEAAIKAANEKLEKYMADDREILLNALNNNTRVMEDMEFYLKNKYKPTAH